MTLLHIPQSVYDAVMAQLSGVFLGFEQFDFYAPMPETHLFRYDHVFLSPHFRLSEVVHSVTASLRSIDNSISPSFILNAAVLADSVLEPLRAQLKRPLVPSSWYRCPELNAAVGGVPTSFHLSARAADIPMNSSEIAIASGWCRSHLVKCIKYKTFLHVQV